MRKAVGEFIFEFGPILMCLVFGFAILGFCAWSIIDSEKRETACLSHGYYWVDDKCYEKIVPARL